MPFELTHLINRVNSVFWGVFLLYKDLSDLTTGDLTASIDISLPKKWTERFHTKAEFKRIMKTPEEEEQNSDNDTQGGGSNSGGTSTEG